jgi:zinc/manganese transport system ATP-binding protein
LLNKSGIGRQFVVQDAPLILLDEPFNAVDGRTTQTLLEIVAQWHAQQRTVVAVIHDEVQARLHFPQTLLLAREVVAWGKTSDVLQDVHLQRVRRLAESWESDGAGATHEGAWGTPRAVGA